MEIIAIIGAEIKRRRKLSAETLSSSNCNCSISYLSKLENGKVFPKYEMLMEICDSRGVNKEELDAMLEIDKAIKKAVIAYFNGDKQFIRQYYNKIANLDNYKVNFIKIFYELSYFHYDKVKELQNSFIAIKDDINDYDQNLILFFEMLIAYHENNYALILSLNEKVTVNNEEYLEALICIIVFKAICKMGIIDPTRMYQELLKHFYNLNFNRYDEYTKMYFESYILLGLSLKESQLQRLDDHERFLYYFIHQNSEAIKELKLKGNFTTFQELCFRYLENDYKGCMKAFNRLNHTAMDPKELLFANYLVIALSDDGEAFYNFLLEEALPFAKAQQSNFLYHLFITKLTEVCYEVGRYKPIVSEIILYNTFLNRGKTCML